MAEVFLLPSAQRDLDRLEDEVLRRILVKIRALGRESRPQGSLKLTAEEGYRLRVGDFRILHRIDDAAEKVYVYRIKHRRDVYSRP